MEKIYISVDIESSGPTPGKYSMLSLGACIVGNTDILFYREIKPITLNFINSAMRVAVRGLKCLEDLKHLEEFDYKSKNFNSSKILDVLYQRAENPEKIMREYVEWIKENTEGFRPVEAVAPIKFDGMFTAWYFDNFYSGENPFGHSGEDINSMFRGVSRDIYTDIKQLGLRKGEPPHNALEDAVIQAKEFERVLEIMKKR